MTAVRQGACPLPVHPRVLRLRNGHPGPVAAGNRVPHAGENLEAFAHAPITRAAEDFR